VLIGIDGVFDAGFAGMTNPWQPRDFQRTVR